MSKKPNILFIFSDQQRWDTLGCYGQKLDVSPHLDQLALEGVRFDKAFTCQPVCGPARSCLQTGLYATETGCFRNDIALRVGERTIAHHLSESGYQVGYVGKWHLASHTEKGIDYRTTAIPPERRGGYKDYWIAADLLEFTSHGYDGYIFDGDMNRIDFEGYRADRITDFAIDYIQKWEQDQPHFLVLSYIEPHHQNDHDRYEGPIGSKKRFQNFDPPGDLAGHDGDWQENYPDYLGCCHSIDANVGRILEALENKGLRENSIIIYTSDHGSHFKTRNQDVKRPRSRDDYKRTCHESALRIPMIAAGGPFKGGQVVVDLVSLIDIAPTIMACADLKKSEVMKGYPLQDILSGKEQHNEIFFQISESQVGRGIRTDRWKYSVYAPDRHPWNDCDSDTYEERFLYDLSNDPYEQVNLVSASEYSDVRSELAEKLTAKMVEAGEQAPVIIAAR